MSADQWTQWVVATYGPEPKRDPAIDWSSSAEREAFVDIFAAMPIARFALYLDDTHAHWGGKGSPYLDIVLRDEQLAAEVARARKLYHARQR